VDGNETRTNSRRTNGQQELGDLHDVFLRQFPAGCNCFCSGRTQFPPCGRQRTSQQ
jgi:hypothetical protein